MGVHYVYKVWFYFQLYFTETCETLYNVCVATAHLCCSILDRAFPDVFIDVLHGDTKSKSINEPCF